MPFQDYLKTEALRHQQQLLQSPVCTLRDGAWVEYYIQGLDYWVKKAAKITSVTLLAKDVNYSPA